MNIGDKIRSFVFPFYSELSLFLINATVALLLVFNQTLQYQFTKEISRKIGPFLFVYIGFATVGFLQSMMHAFFKFKKHNFIKKIILWHVIILNCLIAYLFYVNDPLIMHKFQDVVALINKTPREELIGIVNINRIEILLSGFEVIYAVLLFMFMRFGFINEKFISNDDAGLDEVLISLAIISIFFSVSNFGFDNHWIVTYNICLTYTLLLNSFVMFLVRKFKIRSGLRNFSRKIGVK